MKKKKFIVLSLLLFGLVLLTSAYFLFPNTINVTTILNASSDRETSDTSSWKTYTYENEWRIKYPAGWRAQVDQDKSGVGFMTEKFQQDDQYTAPCDDSAKVSYTIFGEHDLSDMQIKVGDQFLNEDKTVMHKVQSVKKLTIDGHEAVEIVYFPVNSKEFLKYRVTVFKDKKAYRFTALFSKENYRKIFDTMMRSLEFVD